MIGITWGNKHHSVGNQELDEQHRVIVDLINQLSDQQASFYTSKKRALEEFDLALSQLKQKILEHLSFEESLLERIGYQDLNSQKISHQRLIKKMNSFSLHDEDSKNELAKFLILWWDKHIIAEDMKYKPYVQNLQLVSRD